MTLHSDLNKTTLEAFAQRHIGPRDADLQAMLRDLGFDSMESFLDACVPTSLRTATPLRSGQGAAEHQALRELADIAALNLRWRSFIGMGYVNALTPPVIQRNILENPGWYTQYTPYQAEIAQGRLEALLNFQTVIADLTALPVANASLLDEATAAAEAMSLAFNAAGGQRRRFVIARDTFPQTRAVVQTRATPLGVLVDIQDRQDLTLDEDTFALLVQYPAADGSLFDLAPLAAQAHGAGALLIVATDLLALTLLKPPGECGADIAIGSSQRFGVPVGYGGPHAAFFATAEKHQRRIPGRLVGLTRDAGGGHALRLALQTREQHIRREKATSNICTSQVLLAIMASMYAVYHGPEGLTAIARRVRALVHTLAVALQQAGLQPLHGPRFDTLTLDPGPQRAAILQRAQEREINLRLDPAGTLGLTLDEATTLDDLRDLAEVFGATLPEHAPTLPELPEHLRRTSPFLTHPTFHRYRSETELLRYIHRLQARDLSLTHAMIPLGSCTMKLNATAEMLPISWPGFAQLHPFVPREQALGYARLFQQLEAWLGDVTGFPAVSLQPNAGSQGEYTGLLVIRGYHHARGETQRDVCLIPASAHGTNPASASMVGMRVVVVRCDQEGNVDIDDLQARAQEHSDQLAALMLTYPSTHGVFEEGVRRICAIIHEHGGQVYMDGANMNAQVGLCRPGELGADVVHLNLHKTFCIPHGGGGPGMGPIGVAAHLAPFLPSHPVVPTGGHQSVGTVAAAPWGSPAILPIPWAYIRMMGADGLRKATAVAILNANYIAHRLHGHYDVLYKGAHGRVAHECILDLRPLKAAANIEVMDVAKRLMDFGFHAPTVSWPVAGTLMVEPTESESREELDRFCDAMITIRDEIRAIERGDLPRDNNPLKRAPHTAADVTADTWDRPYTRSQAAWPAPWLRERKFWPFVNRVDDAYGDRNLICTCPPLDTWEA